MSLWCVICCMSREVGVLFYDPSLHLRPPACTACLLPACTETLFCHAPGRRRYLLFLLGGLLLMEACVGGLLSSFLVPTSSASCEQIWEALEAALFLACLECYSCLPQEVPGDTSGSLLTFCTCLLLCLPAFYRKGSASRVSAACAISATSAGVAWAATALLGLTCGTSHAPASRTGHPACWVDGAACGLPPLGCCLSAAADGICWRPWTCTGDSSLGEPLEVQQLQSPSPPSPGSLTMTLV